MSIYKLYKVTHKQYPEGAIIRSRSDPMQDRCVIWDFWWPTTPEYKKEEDLEISLKLGNVNPARLPWPPEKMELLYTGETRDDVVKQFINGHFDLFL